MRSSESITLTRSCEAIEVPSGAFRLLPAGANVRIMQNLGGSYTVTVSDYGGMFRIDAHDADALGLSVPAGAHAPESAQGELSEELVWKELKTVYDPEIPVNIVDLGLIYSCVIGPPEEAGKVIDIKMSITAPGCGMADVLKADVERKLSRLPGVERVQVEVVFDPPWNPGRMSEAAKLQLGLDVDYVPDPSPASLPIMKEQK
jgi:probable FeS assembly SUF system protein SufT